MGDIDRKWVGEINIQIIQQKQNPSDQQYDVCQKSMHGFIMKGLTEDKYEK